MFTARHKEKEGQTQTRVAVGDRETFVSGLVQRVAGVDVAGFASHASGILRGGLESVFAGPARLAIPLALTLILVLQFVFIFTTAEVASPLASPALASRCTLSLTGGASVQTPGSTTWEDATNGMTLEAGSRVRTDASSQALLTFFNGTTITLEPGTDISVERLEYNGEKRPAVIVLKQWLGKTWSRVTKLVDPASRYEIQTPSAIALVRGTQFITAVDEAGATKVQTIEGLVSVSAEGREVYLPAGQQTTVAPGAPPSEPVAVSYSEIQGPPGQPGGPSGNLAAAGTSAEKTQSNEPAGDNKKVEGPQGQTGGGEPSPVLAPGNLELPGGRERLSWVSKDDGWMVAYFTGVVLFVVVLTLIILRKR